MKKPIYLDYNATTPVDPAVFQAMEPYLKEKFGNASSASHSYGWEANMATGKARKQVADLIGCKASEIIFTGGATESNNICIQGAAKKHLIRREPIHVITSKVEHKCVLDCVNALKDWGAEVTCIAPDKNGRVSAAQVKEAIKPHTKLVSLIYGNNEIGTINPITEIGELLEKENILFHTDAAQAVGKVDIDVKKQKIDFLSSSSQKMYGPKGVGFLYINKDNVDAKLDPIFFGGSQEKGLRPGTLNVAGIVGLGKACEIFKQEMSTEIQRLQKLQKEFTDRILKLDPSIHINGCVENRLCTNMNFTFPNIKADLFAGGLEDLAVSSGSACSSGEPSYVLKALGHENDTARKSVRIGIGRFTKEDELNTAYEIFKNILNK